MALQFDPASLRARFAELTAQHDAIHAQADPLRAERDAILQQAEAIKATAAPLTEQIRAIEAPLHEVAMERASLAQFLNGKTG